MAIYTETLTDDTNRIIFEVKADPEQRGTAMTEFGMWYSPDQIVQITDMLARASALIKDTP